ncbi:hypothetical protein VHEMI08128 [[Torrubiella] hemipterigena]|uniref:Uncharacterized protein n=1 Tax=[Torrubiella] hemipterigena TaxID=1531966 RepID=A0A0A1TP51_9HYPO|nr:hypothetical protein VHEMI08128 [[Torrubiella] hemipterigena]
MPLSFLPYEDDTQMRQKEAQEEEEEEVDLLRLIYHLLSNQLEETSTIIDTLNLLSRGRCSNNSLYSIEFHHLLCIVASCNQQLISRLTPLTIQIIVDAIHTIDSGYIAGIVKTIALQLSDVVTQLPPDFGKELIVLLCNLPGHLDGEPRTVPPNSYEQRLQEINQLRLPARLAIYDVYTTKELREMPVTQFDYLIQYTLQLVDNEVLSPDWIYENPDVVRSVFEYEDLPCQDSYTLLRLQRERSPNMRRQKPDGENFLGRWARIDNPQPYVSSRLLKAYMDSNTKIHENTRSATFNQQNDSRHESLPMISATASFHFNPASQSFFDIVVKHDFANVIMCIISQRDMLVKAEEPLESNQMKALRLYIGPLMGNKDIGYSDVRIFDGDFGDNLLRIRVNPRLIPEFFPELSQDAS